MDNEDTSFLVATAYTQCRRICDEMYTEMLVQGLHQDDYSTYTVASTGYTTSQGAPVPISSTNITQIPTTTVEAGRHDGLNSSVPGTQFHYFTHFPKEVQDLIWKEAAREVADQPRVYHFRLTGRPMSVLRAHEEHSDAAPVEDIGFYHLARLQNDHVAGETRAVRNLAAAHPDARRVIRLHFLPDMLTFEGGQIMFNNARDVVVLAHDGMSSGAGRMSALGRPKQRIFPRIRNLGVNIVRVDDRGLDWEDEISITEARHLLLHSDFRPDATTLANAMLWSGCENLFLVGVAPSADIALAYPHNVPDSGAPLRKWIDGAPRGGTSDPNPCQPYEFPEEASRRIEGFRAVEAVFRNASTSWDPRDLPHA